MSILKQASVALREVGDMFSSQREATFEVWDDPEDPKIKVTVYRLDNDSTVRSLGKIWLWNGKAWESSPIGEVILDQEPKASMLFGLLTRFTKHIKETDPRTAKRTEFWDAISRIQDEALRVMYQ